MIREESGMFQRIPHELQVLNELIECRLSVDPSIEIFFDIRLDHIGQIAVKHGCAVHTVHLSGCALGSNCSIRSRNSDTSRTRARR